MCSMHICVTMPMTKAGVADQFIEDIKEGTAKIMKNPTKETTGGVSVIRHDISATNVSIPQPLASLSTICTSSVCSKALGKLGNIVVEILFPISVLSCSPVWTN